MTFNFNRPFSLTYDPEYFCRCINQFNSTFDCKVDDKTGEITLKSIRPSFKSLINPTATEEEVTLTTKKVTLNFQTSSHISDKGALSVHGITSDDRCFSLFIKKQSSKVTFYKCSKNF